MEQSYRRPQKRVFGVFEFIFDSIYLVLAVGIGILLFFGATTPTHYVAALSAFTLAGGDAFHLIPRLRSIHDGTTEKYKRQLSIGKFVTSISMTLFYVLLWFILSAERPGFIHPLFTGFYLFLALARILLCLPKQNQWFAEEQPVNWGIYRNIPFVLMGMQFIIFSLPCGSAVFFWLAVAVGFSFLFYLPVVLWVNKNRMLGMLMLPKCLAYLWILILLMKL